MNQTVLLTGGTGFIGSHTAVALQEAGFHVVLADNLSNSAPDIPDRIAAITGSRPEFVRCDCADPDAVEALFSSYCFDAVIHFAGYKAVGESVEKPLLYYRNNLDTLITVAEAMVRHSVRCLVFSSSATVYGANLTPPYTEEMEAGQCINPYGRTKFMLEQILRDLGNANPEMSIALLRYFNPIGAHPSGLLGERPNGIPNNLLPYITQVAAGQRDCLRVFGNDYPTPDGTCIRDYLHVCDLASGHEAALRWCMANSGVEVFNLGTGSGFSVLEMISAFERATGVSIPYQIAGRRAGDLPVCLAGTEKAAGILNWHTEKTIDDMCRDAWHWQQNLAREG